MTEFVSRILLPFKFALREMRGGLNGFAILIACIALGVGAISGVNTVSRAIMGTIAAQGQAILGGDLAFSTQQAIFPDEVSAFLGQRGTIVRTVSLRAMARRQDGSDQTLVELKAVGAGYPLYGEVAGKNGNIDPGAAGDDAVFAEPILLERLGLKPGDSIAIGDATFTLRDVIVAEPDRLSDGAVFGPRVMMTLGGLEKAGLVRPGSLVSSRLALRMGSGGDVQKLALDAASAFPEAGYRIQTRDNAAPSLSRNVERFSQFLSLVGLAALVVGGVGVANAARAFLERKRETIATLKAVGAPAPFIFALYLIQIMMLAAMGVAGGLVLGVALPLAARQVLSDAVGFPLALVVSPQAMLLGAAYGFLTAFVFVVWPIGQARETPAATLFRSSQFGNAYRPRAIYVVMLAGGLFVLCALAIATSGQWQVSAVFLAATAAAFVALTLVGAAIKFIARRAPKPRATALRMALANLCRPGALTTPVVLSLGLGLTLIVALAVVDDSLRQQVAGNLPKEAPSFFMADVQGSEIEPLTRALEKLAPDGKVQSVPMIRGRITHLNGIAAAKHPEASTSWVLRGDRGITHSVEKPANATLVSGNWWSKDHAGEPLVSFSREEADELGLAVGDTITVNVLGRPLTARIANLRSVEWESLAINFVMVFSPNSFAGAPHGWLATLTFPDGAVDDIARDGRILTAVTKAFPGVTSVRVRDAINRVNALIGQLAQAIQAVSAVALITAMLVLAGALAAGNRARGYDAVVLKTLGASRRTILASFAAEYAMLGLATAIFALAAGSLAAFLVITFVMEFTAIFSPWLVIGVVAGALCATVGLGLAGTYRLLQLKAAPVLREL